MAAGCVNEQLFVTRTAAGPRLPGTTGEAGHRANNCSEPDTLRDLLDPEARTIIHFRQQVKARVSRNRTIIRSGQQVEPGWAGTRKANNGGFLRVWWWPEARMTRRTARTRSLGESEPDCPRHPRKCFLLICGFYATMFYRVWVVMGSVRYFHAFMGKFLKFL